MDSVLRALIVDDDPSARERLRFLLGSRPDLEVVGEANSVATGALLCGDLHPNLIFLDVEMPGGDGFSLLEKLNPAPAVIFVTAYDEFAVRAFEVNAIDYLLKPVNQKRLNDAIRRVVHEPPATQTMPFRKSDRFYLPHGDLKRVVFLLDVSGIEAQENYTNVLLRDGSHVLMRSTLEEWERRLPSEIFCAAHRSLIVNLEAIHGVVMESSVRLSFSLKGHERVYTLGQRPASRLREALRLMRRP